MWIKIKEKSINFNNVVNYLIQKIELRDKGVKNGEFKYMLWIETINEDDSYGGLYINYDTKIEAMAIIKQLDKLLNVVSL
tara:strand:- start:724 stop:963 length:240 start_codon:yes stop_codon:yes gene_type:complete